MCYQFCDSCKILSFGHHLKEVEMKITYACPFLRVSQKSEKILRVYMVLGDAVSTLQTFVWILNHEPSRSITWSLFILKASNLVKRQLWTRSFMWWCQFIDWLKFETRPSSLRNSGMANWYLILLANCIFISSYRIFHFCRRSSPHKWVQSKSSSLDAWKMFYHPLFRISRARRVLLFIKV